ncbi:Ig-like domain-containing protein, partial [Azospirillum sp. sgz302134]
TGDTLELLLGGAALGHPVTRTLTATDIANGYVDLTVTAGDLGTDGAKTFTARVTDVAGNVGTAGGSLSITLDTAPPAAPTGVAVSTADDTGTSTTDGLTNKARPAITGTAEPNGTVTVTIDGVDVGTTKADATGAWSYTPTTDLGNGAHTVTSRTTDASGNTGNSSSTYTVTVDRTAPTVVSVSAPADKTYKLGDVLSFTVTFPEAVSGLSGSTLALTVDQAGGSATRQATLASSTATTATYSYTVQAGDLDGNGVTVNGLSAPNATDAAGNALVTTLNGVASTAQVKVDGVAPTVASVTLPAAKTYLAGEVLEFVVTFDDATLALANAGSSALAFTLGGVAKSAAYAGQTGGAVTYRYTVASGDDSTTGVTVSGITLGTATYTDPAGNPADLSLAGKVGSGAGIMVDTMAPTVTGVTSTTANGAYKAGDTITIKVAFSEAVVVNGAPTLALNSGRTASYASGSGTDTLTFTYTVADGDTVADLDVASTAALAGTIKDMTGNAAPGTLPAPGGANSLGAAKDIVLDTTAPTVVGVKVPDAGTYLPGDTLSFTVRVSEPVTVAGGTPTLTLVGGGTPRNAVYNP